MSAKGPISRLKESLAWRVFPWARLRMDIAPECRLLLRNRGDFIILREIFIDEVYSPFLQKAGPVRTWVDLGCNCGMFSLYLHYFAHKSGWDPLPRHGVLVDANADALAAARESIAASETDARYDFHLSVVAGRDARESTFYEGKTTHKSSLHSLGSRGRKRTRPVLDLNAATKDFGSEIDLLKVDIEGAETYLFSDWEDFLVRARHLIFEWHEPHMSGTELDARLAALGYHYVAGEQSTKGEALAMPTGTGLWSR